MIQENFDFDKDIKVNHGLKYSLQPAHLQEIIKAILHGKYSWACVLFLRFSGYDPSEYIPYTTYKKLVKENYIPNQNNQSYHHDQPVNKSVNNPVVRIY